MSRSSRIGLLLRALFWALVTALFVTTTTIVITLPAQKTSMGDFERGGWAVLYSIASLASLYSTGFFFWKATGDKE